MIHARETVRRQARLDGLVVEADGARIVTRCACCGADVAQFYAWSTERMDGTFGITCFAEYCKDAVARGVA